jgi:hypothetical protein
MNKTEKKVKSGRGPTEFPGITDAAAELGVSRSSLWRALTGEWNLPKLVARYNRLPSVKKLIKQKELAK